MSIQRSIVQRVFNLDNNDLYILKSVSHNSNILRLVPDHLRTWLNRLKTLNQTRGSYFNDPNEVLFKTIMNLNLLYKKEISHQ